MTKASLSGLAFLINLAQERDSPGGFAALDPLRACGALRASLKNAGAFPQLRTLAGSNPCAGNKKASRSGQLLQSIWRRERDSPGDGRRPPSAARLRRLRATLENGLRRFLSSAPSRVRIHARATKKRATGPASAINLAEREGFEPSEHLRAQRFSRPPHSTALPSLRRVG